MHKRHLFLQVQNCGILFQMILYSVIRYKFSKGDLKAFFWIVTIGYCIPQSNIICNVTLCSFYCFFFYKHVCIYQCFAFKSDFCITESVIAIFCSSSHKIIIHNNYFYRGAYYLQALLFSRPSFPFNFMFILFNVLYCANWSRPICI